MRVRVMMSQDAIEHHWRQLFAAAWRSILQSESLKRLPPNLKVRFSRRIDARQCARIEWNGNVRIVISTKFAVELHRELAELAPTLVGLAFASTKARRKRCLEAVCTIEDLAVSFILFHEIFHLMGGHLDWTSQQRGLAQFDEQKLWLAFSTRSPERSSKRFGRTDLSTSYVLESEADCNAIQWLLQYAELSGLRQLLRSKGQPVIEWAPEKRQTAFRLALAAVWLVIRKLESLRASWLQPRGTTHPLPVTRVFMAFGTFLREYSSISDLEYDEAGGGQRRLTGKDVTSMREFLLHAMGPVLKADWSPGKETVPPNSLEGQMRIYFPDFANHMLNREVKTRVGRQILQMERARFRMDRTLRPFRFFPIAELRRRERSES
jgi:hypothetical protein